MTYLFFLLSIFEYAMLLNLFAEVPPVAGPPSERLQTECLCRSMLEQMLAIKLPKTRPKWLMNPIHHMCFLSFSFLFYATTPLYTCEREPTTKRALELDMYCDRVYVMFFAHTHTHTNVTNSNLHLSLMAVSMMCTLHTIIGTKTIFATDNYWIA